MIQLTDTWMLATAPLIGFAFGWFLERGGLGSARRLMQQFACSDFALLRTLFTAIVTAMLGVYWLDRAGVMDASALYVPETFLLPQAVGGAVFGAGFLLAGLCPGTACVAAASGKLDGVPVMVGLLLGIAAFNTGYGVFGRFASSTPRGVMTLPSVLGVTPGVVILGVTTMAIACIALARIVERRHA